MLRGRSIANGQRAIPSEYSFSDDELAFLAYANMLLGVQNNNSRLVQAARTGLARSWDVVAHERAGIWHTVALAALMKTGGIPPAPPGVGRPRDPAAAVADTLWNLRTWPLEWVEWANDNSHRLDLVYQTDEGNQNQGDPRDAPLLATPLPDNERSQFRWNQPAFGAGDSSPRIAEGQLAGGKSVEFDTGAWVLPYWMARHYGIIAPPPR